MPIRDYNFLNGPETATLPAASDPVDSGDLIPLGYAQENFAAKSAESFLGPGFLNGSFDLSNNQSSAANVTGLLFNSAQVRSALLYYAIVRITDSDKRVESGLALVSYIDSTDHWEIVPIGAGPHDSGVTLSIDDTGQGQYTSDNMSGSFTTQKIIFKAWTLGV